MNQHVGPLVVEVFLEGARAIGVCRQVQQRRRLIDILNTQEPVIELEEASVFLAGTVEPKHYPSLAIIKHTIIAAVPRETQEQNRMRAVLTSVMGRQATAKQHVSLVVPPLAIVGDAHMPMGAGVTVNVTERLSKFFPVTAASLVVPGEAARDVDVVLVSREHVVGTSVAPVSHYASAV
jgi:hypothetical protein